MYVCVSRVSLKYKFKYKSEEVSIDRFRIKSFLNLYRFYAADFKGESQI